MNDRQFDSAVRSLVRRRTRRAFAGGLLGVALAPLTGRLRATAVAARQGYSVQGEPCVDDSQCLAADTPLVCAYNGFGGDGLACCAPYGGRCATYADCCGPASCYGDRCWDMTLPSAGEACWLLPGDPDPCADGLACDPRSWQSGGTWGTCEPVFTSPDSDASEWCGDHFCEPGQRCCSQCSGVCAPRGAVCGEGACRSGFACPDECYADDWCEGCLSGFCRPDGACA